MLTGLPAESRRCPECGFEYDEFSQGWEDANRGSFKKAAGLWATGILFIVFLAGGLITQSLFGRLRAPVGTPLQVMWVFELAVFAMAFWLCWRSARHRSFVATTPRGVVFRTGMPEIKTVPWRRIARVECSATARPFSAQLRLRGPRWRALAVSMWWALKSSKEVREFAKAVEDGKRRYGARAE